MAAGEVYLHNWLLKDPAGSRTMASPKPSAPPVVTIPTDIPINASGHRQELDRHFNLLSICDLALTSRNTWVALG